MREDRWDVRWGEENLREIKTHASISFPNLGDLHTYTTNLVHRSRDTYHLQSRN